MEVHSSVHFVSLLETIISETAVSQGDIIANYEIGVITFHEKVMQLQDVGMSYSIKVHELVKDAMECLKVSRDYLLGAANARHMTF